tara:strand:- start:342 stop:557 length:216 start_codon:yes stop_codon:yes gene_type:complete
MNIFKVIGKLSYHTKKASTVAIQQPKKAWSDIKQGYEAEEWAEDQLQAELREERMAERVQEQQSFDFGDLR